MKLAYLDLISGASGDMLLGALVDAGLPFADLQQALAGLHLPGFELSCAEVMRGAFAATKIDVHTDDHAPARHLPEIEAIINASSLPPTIQAASLRIFRRMIAVEASIHNAPSESVHLHELGALDTIVDVTGVLLGLELLGVERVICSPVPLGRGTLTGSHGRMPLPAPATVALLTGAPVVGVDHALETVTPTAAALITELASAYGSIPAMRLQGGGLRRRHAHNAGTQRPARAAGRSRRVHRPHRRDAGSAGNQYRRHEPGDLRLSG